MIDIKKRKNILNIASWVALLSWPVGFLFGWFISIGQDPAGAGMSAGIGLLIIVIFFNIPATICLFYFGRGLWKNFNFRQKSSLLIPFIPFFLVVIFVISIFMIEILS